MNQLATTKMSSKGQIVIPEHIRQKMGLNTGDQFLVVAENDVVILKSIAPPSTKEFKNLISKARKTAKQAGLTKTDVKAEEKKTTFADLGLSDKLLKAVEKKGFIHPSPIQEFPDRYSVS